MKNKDLMFYTVIALSFCALALPVLAVQYSLVDSFPGQAWVIEWLKAGEEFALSRG